MRFFKRPEFQLPLYFIIVSVLWIVGSDLFFYKFEENISPSTITYLQSIKGSFYVIVVAFIIHLFIKSSNKKLLQSQEEYKDLFYNTPNPMFVYDANNKKLHNINKAAIETYGYSRDELTQMYISDIQVSNIHTEDTLKVTSCKVRRHKKKNNQVILCQETTREITIKDKPACLLSALDVTEHEQAKYELLNREKQLRSILNSITDVFFILKPDFTVEKANEHFKMVVEVPVDSVEGKKLPDLFPSLNNSETFKIYREALEKRSPVHFENNHLGNWFRISAYPYEAGLSVFIRNVTKEKMDEFHNYKNQQNLVALINNTEDLIWSIDNNYRYFTFNEAYEKGYKLFVGENLWIGKSALHEKGGCEHIKKWKELYGRALNGEKFCTEMEFFINDDCRFTTVRFNPIFNAENKVIGVGCFLQDITERKLHERKIQQQNEKLKEIAFITSHKVRLPLANILGLTEIFDREDPLNIANNEIIDHLKTSARQLDHTISNMIRQTAKINE